MGLDFKSHSVIMENTILKLNIVDTAGQEKYKSMSPIFFRYANGAILVFDVTDK